MPDGFQLLLSSSVWDTDALRDDVRDYVVEGLGPSGVILDDTGSRGEHHVGRTGGEYADASGMIDNCQIGVFAAYATSSGRTLVDRELHLWKFLTSDRNCCPGGEDPDKSRLRDRGGAGQRYPGAAVWSRV
ncbi:DDE superfamily endonuclease [Streptomyces sp. MnatMP-M77]|uniref:transposase n=1 Tax=unclassified Streptomyces TaxID=2593676 RepID=UPI000805A857|nr:transposase [Streptomyces sp. MnatMP-M77]MYT82448.1 hypothetical protein [Streptomyces sp. SID8364]SBU96683.1 DDE superfamily endonuclease [Streptomyces sp. MnatMP-M77]